MEEPEKVWPPPPSQTQIMEECLPQQIPLGQQRLGQCSLALSSIATACALLYTLLIPFDGRGENWGTERYVDKLDGVFLTLQLASFAFFVFGLLIGIFGWRSWQGKVGIALSAISPIWILIWFIPTPGYVHP